MACTGTVTSMREKEYLGVYTCPVCRDYLEEPRLLNCKHAFCLKCLEGVLQAKQPNSQFSCPTCREHMPISGALENLATEVDAEMRQRQIVCPTCRQLIRLANFRRHRERCESGAGSPALSNPLRREGRRLPVVLSNSHSVSSVPRSESSNDRPEIGTTGGSNGSESLGEIQHLSPMSNAPRSGLTRQNTFMCPYCGQVNLSQKELVLHCWTKHKHDRNHQRVCPICVAMPWGNPEQESKNLIGHLVLRHRTDYGSICQHNQDEEAALRIAVHRSLTEYHESFRNDQ